MPDGLRSRQNSMPYVAYTTETKELGVVVVPVSCSFRNMTTSYKTIKKGIQVNAITLSCTSFDDNTENSHDARSRVLKSDQSRTYRVTVYVSRIFGEQKPADGGESSASSSATGTIIDGLGGRIKFAMNDGHDLIAVYL